MAKLPSSVTAARKVQNNIERFETLSLSDSTNGSSNRSLLEIVTADDGLRTPTFNSATEKPPLVEISRPTLPPQPIISSHKRHQKHDSTAFLQQVYLQKSAPSSLPDDAREILRCQPDDEDLIAVLQYLQYGIENQHDFSLRTISPKGAQIIHTLVTVTIPDHWTSVSTGKLSKSKKEIKKILLSCLTSAAGIGALLAQIRKTSVVSNSVNGNQATAEAKSVLAQVLMPLDIVSILLRDTLALKAKPAQCKAVWQEVCSLLGGSKVLATVAHVSANIRVQGSEDHEAEWLADGTRYAAWLANRITSAATTLKPNDAESPVLLSQLLKRGMSLGYRGESFRFLRINTMSDFSPTPSSQPHILVS